MRICIFSVPRSGAHLLTHSIAFSLKIPYGTNYSLFNQGTLYHLPKQEDWVIATHEPQTESLDAKLKKYGAIKFHIERNELDNFISYMAFYKNELPINDQKLFSTHLFDTYKMFRVHNVLWKKMADVSVSYESFVDPNSPTFEVDKKKIENAIGHALTITPLEKSKELAPNIIHGSSKGRIGLWKEILTSETVQKYNEMFGTTFDPKESKVKSAEEGNNLYLELYGSILDVERPT